MSTRDRDAVATDNAELRNELGMYKSVMVPSEGKPRTNITRIERAPLANQNLNVMRPTGQRSINRRGEKDAQVLITDHIPGEMTLDEIL